MSTTLSRRDDLRGGLLVFVVTVLLAQGLWLSLPPSLRRMDSGDFRNVYGPAARRLAHGAGLVDETGVPVTRYPPGYPILLAPWMRLSDATGLDEAAVIRWFQLTCAGLGGVLLYALARRLWSPRGALLVGLLWAAYPPGLWLTRYPSSELPYMLPFLGSLLLLWDGLRSRRCRRLRLVGAGVLAGTAALIRPVAIGLGPALAALAWLGLKSVSPRRRAVLSVLILAGAGASILPWEWWVWKRTGQVVPLSSGGAVSLLDGWAYAVDPAKPMASGPPPDDVVELMQAIWRARPEFRSLGEGGRVIAREAAARPRAALSLAALKSLRCWYGTDSGRFERATMAFQAAVAFLSLLAAVRAWRRGGRFRLAVAGIGLLLIYSWVMATLFLSIARYLVPSIVLTFLLWPQLLPVAVRPDKEAS